MDSVIDEWIQSVSQSVSQSVFGLGVVTPLHRGSPRLHSHRFVLRQTRCLPPFNTQRERV